MSTKGMTFHRHKCPKCSHIWRHSNKLRFDDVEFDKAHRCPKCGRRNTAKLLPKKLPKRPRQKTLVVRIDESGEDGAIILFHGI